MSHFVADPELTLPAFEPRFGVHRLIKDRGGIYDARFRDGRLSPPPPNSKLDSLHGTLLALDPLLVALVIAGYDPRELVIATSDYGSEVAQSQGHFWASLRSGLGLAMPGNWTEFKGIVDPGTWHSRRRSPSRFAARRSRTVRPVARVRRSVAGTPPTLPCHRLPSRRSNR